MKELKKCVYYYKNFWNSCTPPATNFVFDSQMTWPVFLNLISRLQLNDSIVTVDFGQHVHIDNAWKCALTSSISTSTSSDAWRGYLSFSRSSLYGWTSNVRYILDGGCLRESSYSSYSHRYSYRLCVSDPANKYTASNDSDDFDDSTVSTFATPQVQFCPYNWFDLNGRCYRISDERKTIKEARKQCINISSNTSTANNDKSLFWQPDVDSNTIDKEDSFHSPTGKLVEYISDWQARMGFFLLDTVPDTGNLFHINFSIIHLKKRIYCDSFQT